MTNKAITGTHAKKPAEISPAIEANRKYFAAHLQVVHCDFERLKHSPHVLENGLALTLIGACEMLLSAAVELHQSMSKVDWPIPSESSKNIQKQRISRHTSEGIEISEHAEESPQFIRMMINKRRGGRPIKEPDWCEIREIRQNRDYNRKQAKIDGKLIPITTFDNYCDYHIGLTSSQVVNYMNHMRDLGDELFLALRKSCIGEMSMRKVKKLTADQKQALLQIAQIGDKAATLAFIQQALEAGE